MLVVGVVLFVHVAGQGIPSFPAALLALEAFGRPPFARNGRYRAGHSVHRWTGNILITYYNDFNYYHYRKYTYFCSDRPPGERGYPERCGTSVR